MRWWRSSRHTLQAKRRQGGSAEREGHGRAGGVRHGRVGRVGRRSRGRNAAAPARQAPAGCRRRPKPAAAAVATVGARQKLFARRGFHKRCPAPAQRPVRCWNSTARTHGAWEGLRDEAGRTKPRAGPQATLGGLLMHEQACTAAERRRRRAQSVLKSAAAPADPAARRWVRMRESPCCSQLKRSACSPPVCMEQQIQ